MTEGQPPDGLEAEERRVAERLASERPIPSATFRGALGRHVAARDPGYGRRPERLWLMVAGYVSIAALLILVGALKAAGSL